MPNQSLPLPRGFRFAGVSCGIKRDPAQLDLTLIASDGPATAAGVFTQNRVAAAPVRVTRQRVPSSATRAIVANSGNANACTGAPGLADARRMAELTAERLGCAPEAVLVCSTGVIGTALPMPLIETGIAQAAAALAGGGAALERAARGIMTTDTVPKIARRSDDAGAVPIRAVGIAKGAAMIGPNMATMLAFVLTDAAVSQDRLQRVLAGAVDETFNRISVEGHTSTNDTVLALANGGSGRDPLDAEGCARLGRLFTDLCGELAQAIVRDAEGAKHLIRIDVTGLRSSDEARRVARAIADSALVKTAIYGGDPNWGRIVSAAGYAGVAFEPEDVSLWLDGTLLFERGAPVPFDATSLSQGLRSRSTAEVRLEFALGAAGCRFWTCDLTEEYIRLNADYHT